MLEIRNLSAAYGMHRALAGVSIDVEESEIVVILGANGAGKSTLLRAVAGMCEGQVQGEVFLDGEPLAGVTADEIVERGIAFVPEGRGIFGDLTVAENLQLGAYSRHARARQQENLAKVYDLFPKLRERKSQTVRTMSGGEQQMVAIGRAIMADPKILMLDEPSLGLSPILCKELFQSLSHITESGMGVLLVEQNAKQSLAIADRGFLLENGEITGQDSAEALLNDPAVQAAYLGGAAGETRTGRAGDAAVAQTPAAAETQKPYIRPSAKAGAAVSADTFAGESISALVARAAGKARVETPTQRPAAPAPQVKAPSITPRGSASSYRIADDPELSKLLKSMEEAAQAARSGGSTYGTRRQSTRIESAPLPEIEVYRKSTVEVYRRGPGGKLEKVEK
ncbi:ABC transporter ATP-binding protein [Roseibium aggregatum]|uniref:ABC transporter ATP-binding protein n=1 Tax=Roseibium aggregatum TaxID=187304 RepID=A0A926NSK2_9HYPH|nr:ABC transporter ATP-binding protein [Roseibium aggregatum]MBD1545674.1 ABC transporter ATP-binding protein [Roseibium aggregatum]